MGTVLANTDVAGLAAGCDDIDHIVGEVGTPQNGLKILLTTVFVPDASLHLLIKSGHLLAHLSLGILILQELIISIKQIDDALPGSPAPNTGTAGEEVIGIIFVVSGQMIHTSDLKDTGIVFILIQHLLAEAEEADRSNDIIL